MPEFLRLIPPSQALEALLVALPDPSAIPTERIPTEQALDRVLAMTVQAPHPLPPFARATVDGYAVRAADTHGASPSLPAYLKLIGEVLMGLTTELAVGKGEAVVVHTGGMLPAGADAVVMVEDTQAVQEDEIEVLKPAGVGENILAEGEDVKQNEVVLAPGVRLRAQEIGGLMALGITEVEVAQRPKVGILSTGDEVVPPGDVPGPGQVRDINSYTLSALVSKAGGLPVRRGVIPDNFDALLTATKQAHAEDDLVVITAGSSVSTRDITAEVIASLGGPGVLVHGVSIKPGKPTILAVAGGVPLIGLPGNPVSALVVAGLFVVPVVRRMLGLPSPSLQPWVPASMAVNVASETGREDYIPVRLRPSPEGWIADPVYGRSNLIFTLVRAEGLVCIPPEATGLAAGEQVKVQLF